MRRYCDECQRTVQDCDASTDCNERHAREYFQALREWEESSDWVSEPPY